MRVIEMSYLRGAKGVSKWDCVSNQSIYERLGIGTYTNGVVWGDIMCGKEHPKMVGSHWEDEE